MPALIDIYDYPAWLAHRIAVETLEISSPHRKPDVAERRLAAFEAAAERVASGDLVGLVGVAVVHAAALTTDEVNALRIASCTINHVAKARNDGRTSNRGSLLYALGLSGSNYRCEADTETLTLGEVRIALRGEP